MVWSERLRLTRSEREAMSKIVASAAFTETEEFLSLLTMYNKQIQCTDCIES